MENYQSDKEKASNLLREEASKYGKAKEYDEQRLLRIMSMPDMEKLKSFTQMLRRNALLKRASIVHKD